MVGFKKILSQTSAYSPKRSGGYNYPIYRITKTVTVAADYIRGTKATYTEVTTRIQGEMFPFLAKDWGDTVTDEFADFTLSTYLLFTFLENDDPTNDEVQYDGIRYRVVKMQEFDRIGYDDHFAYALRRLSGQAGGLAG